MNRSRRSTMWTEWSIGTRPWEGGGCVGGHRHWRGWSVHCVCSPLDRNSVNTVCTEVITGKCKSTQVSLSKTESSCVRMWLDTGHFTLSESRTDVRNVRLSLKIAPGNMRQMTSCAHAPCVLWWLCRPTRTVLIKTSSVVNIAGFLYFWGIAGLEYAT